MTLKIWTSPLTWNALRPDLVLAEKGITDVQAIQTDIIKGTHKSPEFLEKSIFGRVPLLEDNDSNNNIVLFESRAISRYLASKYAIVGPQLVPSPSSTTSTSVKGDGNGEGNGDAQTRALWEMRLLVEAIEFETHFTPVATEMLVKPALGTPQDTDRLEFHKPKLLTCLDALDKSLSKMPYMGGDEYSLVDICYMPGMYICTRCGGDLSVFEGRPNLRRWWDDVSSRQAWKKVVRPLDDAYGQILPGWKS